MDEDVGKQKQPYYIRLADEQSQADPAKLGELLKPYDADLDRMGHKHPSQEAARGRGNEAGRSARAVPDRAELA